MNDDKTKTQVVLPVQEKEVYGPSIVEDLLELLNDKEEYPFG